mmetsp:Transcript_9076/g.15081  ORF Transcript_9076/g.15081 Transcript_9076/m.15081 type:complete len:451 (+) Transcript_9076:901-2253(+)
MPISLNHAINRHGKFESVGSLFLSLTLIVTGVSVGSWSYSKMLDVIMNSGTAPSSPLALVSGALATLRAGATQIPGIVAHGTHHAAATAAVGGGTATAVVKIPSLPALGLAAFSIASKEWLFRVTKRVGDSLNSQILIANAWHHRSDAFSSILSLFSIAAAIFLPGFLVADSAAGMFIAGMITLTGLEVLTESVKQLTDASDEALVRELEAAAASIEGVEALSDVRARRVGSGSIVDMTVLTDFKISATAAAAIAERARWHIIEKFPQRVLDVQVRTKSSASGVACPLLARNPRSTEAVECEVREILMKSSSSLADGAIRIGDQSIKRVIVHYINSAALCVEVLIQCFEDISLADAKQVAKSIQHALLRDVVDIVQVDVQLDLTGHLPAPAPIQVVDDDGSNSATASGVGPSVATATTTPSAGVNTDGQDNSTNNNDALTAVDQMNKVVK